MNMMRLLFHWEHYEEEVNLIFVDDFRYDVRFMQGSVMLDICLHIINKLSSIIKQLPDGLTAKEQRIVQCNHIILV